MLAGQRIMVYPSTFTLRRINRVLKIIFSFVRMLHFTDMFCVNMHSYTYFNCISTKRILLQGTDFTVH